jgi:hypothetical protein
VTRARLLLNMFLGAAASVAALLIVMGRERDNRSSGRFDVTGKVDHFAGPTPVISRFSATAKNANGDVIYRWRFDDGTTSREQSVTHSFKRAGYYQVILDARDEEGNNDRETFLLGAWPPKQWADSLRTTITPEFAAAAQRVQQRRTKVRHAEVRERLRRLARGQTEG